MIRFELKVCDYKDKGLERLINILSDSKIIFDMNHEITDEVCEKGYYGVKYKSKYTVYIFPRDNEKEAIKELLNHFNIEFTE